jgi:CheY-like chemotaxis protein
MNFLIVDDDDIKVHKIKQLIESFSLGPCAISIQQTVAETVGYLLNGPSVDIMILDLNLPIRKDGEVKMLSGLRVINEINKRKEMSRPTYILGITADIPPKEEAERFFREEGWALVGYDPSNSCWEDMILNKMAYANHSRGIAAAAPKKAILYLAATPTEGRTILLGKEERRIGETLQMSNHRDDFSLVTKQGCTFRTMSLGLMVEKPEILHFSGHGDEDGIALEDESGNINYIATFLLQELLAEFAENLTCIILSTCYSSPQAQTLSSTGLYVIGMSDSISVGIGEEFSVGFYQALGERRDIPTCFNMGKMMVKSKYPKSIDLPELWHNGKLI